MINSCSGMLLNTIKLPLAELVFNRSSWWPVAAIGTIVVVLLMLCNYSSHGVLKRPATWISMLLKTLAFAAIAICLLEPMNSFEWPRPQENVVGVLLDASESMNIGVSSDQVASLQSQYLTNDAAWQRRIAQDFDVRRYAFGSETRSLDELNNILFDQRQSNLASAIEVVQQRMQKRPLVALFAFTDGNATDAEQLDRIIESQSESDTSPIRIYPVMIRENAQLIDLRIADVSVQVADFESSPIGMDVRLDGIDVRGESIVIRVINDDDEKVHEQTVTLPTDRDEHRVPIRFTSAKPGVQRFRLEAFLSKDTQALSGSDSTVETTLANNKRFVVVNRGAGPYRVLYISGRPNWDFKFLRRAMTMDREVDLVGLIRIAKREAKFTFRDQTVADSNSLFSGFEDNSDGAAEQSDEPVFIRLGVRDAQELSKGFPETVAELYAYHMVVIDDMESDFFTSSQMQMIRRFVSERGGTLLMLGGAEAFRGRAFVNGPFSQLMPFYFANRDDASGKLDQLKFDLTREGWLQPSLRIEETEPQERERLERMPLFRSPSLSSGVKPGAVVYASGEDPSGTSTPLLATQRFGRGKTGAFLLSDFWRWALANPKATHEVPSSSIGRTATYDDPKLNPAMIAWRQLFRWMITDVPDRVDAEILITKGNTEVSTEDGNSKSVSVKVFDEEFKPIDNVTVNIEVKTPDGKTLKQLANPSDDEPGTFLSQVYPGEDGAYVVTATAMDSEGEVIRTDATGFVINQAADELGELQPNADLMERLAQRTGGRVLQLSELESEAAKLPELNLAETIRRVEPLWHQSYILLFAFAALLTEWGLRRWRGLP